MYRSSADQANGLSYVARERKEGGLTLHHLVVVFVEADEVTRSIVTTEIRKYVEELTVVEYGDSTVPRELRWATRVPDECVSPPHLHTLWPSWL